VKARQTGVGKNSRKMSDVKMRGRGKEEDQGSLGKKHKENK